MACEECAGRTFTKPRHCSGLADLRLPARVGDLPTTRPNVLGLIEEQQFLSTSLEVNELLQPTNPALENLDGWATVQKLPVVFVWRALGETNARSNLTQFAAGLCARLHAKRVKWPNARGE
jgi:hypothetical protein